MSDETEDKPAASADTPASRFPYKPAQWQKGQSGNPAGRAKKDRDILKQAKDAADEGMKTLVKLMRSSDERVALQAAQAIIDRAIGKPTQTNVNVSKQDVADLDIAELYAIATGSGSGDHSEDRGQEGSDPIH